MVLKEENFEKSRHVKKRTNLKKIFYEDKEMLVTMIEIYLIKRNLISFFERTISFSFISARTFDRARTFTRTFDRDFVRGEYNE